MKTFIRNYMNVRLVPSLFLGVHLHCHHYFPRCDQNASFFSANEANPNFSVFTDTNKEHFLNQTAKDFLNRLCYLK